MKVAGNRKAVTSKVVNEVQREIKEEGTQRRAELRLAVECYGELAEGLAQSDRIELVDLTRMLWTALMDLWAGRRSDRTGFSAGRTRPHGLFRADSACRVPRVIGNVASACYGWRPSV